MTSPVTSYPTRKAFAAALRDFVNVELPRLHSKMTGPPNVSDETLLFATGIIDSMAILHLIAFVEHATGRSIPPEKVVMKHFQSVSAIAESFCSPSSP
ncbi:MAG: acyl carrier protein [Opitutaceae bacterium]